MASAEVAARLQQDRPRRKPLAQFFKTLTNRKNKSNDVQDKSNGKKNAITGSKSRRPFGNDGTLKNNPYPQSGQYLQQRRDHSLDSSANGNLSLSVASRRDGHGSFDSLRHERDAPAHSNRSGAPTLATNPETIHSDAGHSKAATTTTHGGALSSIDGAGADSTFSSPRNSQQSLSTTLTTIQSTSPGTTLQATSGHPSPYHNSTLNSPNPIMFSHQYPVSPAPSTANTISAIPRHLHDTTYHSATANNLLSDNASILTLASSSKRRRRSMDTDASVRALAPRSEWGGSRESLPLSVLSGNVDSTSLSGGGGGQGSGLQYGPSRPSISGVASAERASIYSTALTGGGGGERNSYYSYRATNRERDLATDSKSLRSVNADARSLGGDVGSIRSGAVGQHSRNGSIPGSIGGGGVPQRAVSGSTGGGGGPVGGLSRRSSEWADPLEREGAENDHADVRTEEEHIAVDTKTESV